MSLPETIQRIYQELAQRYGSQKEPRLRDVFMMLAADAAHASGRKDDADKLRRAMLEANPNSLLRPFPSFAAALQSLDIQDYLADLRRQYPPDVAEKLLEKVRANPLGPTSDPRRSPSQHDTQEVIPSTARTVNMAPPTKKSPYEPAAAAPPSPALEVTTWGTTLSLVWFFVASVAGLAFAAWTLARPFWESA
jgi:hypothetical protein